MGNDLEYNINFFKTKEVTGENPLLWVTKYVFQKHGLCEAFNIAEDKLVHFVNEIEDSYNPTNPYHNNTHAADVTWSLHYLCTSGLDKTLSKLEIFACFFAAIVHDCDHPGFNNNFLIATSHQLALLHNDISPLENHHCSTGFSYALKPQNNILEGMKKQDYKKFRSLAIYFVLGTDFGRNSEIMQRLEQLACYEWPTDNVEERKLIILLCLKCADIGHVSKSFELHR